MTVLPPVVRRGPGPDRTGRGGRRRRLRAGRRRLVAGGAGPRRPAPAAGRAAPTERTTRTSTARVDGPDPGPGRAAWWPSSCPRSANHRGAASRGPRRRRRAPWPPGAWTRPGSGSSCRGGHQPGSAADTPDQLRVDFGAPLDEDVVPALRRGNPADRRREAIDTPGTAPGRPAGRARPGRPPAGGRHHRPWPEAARRAGPGRPHRDRAVALRGPPAVGLAPGQPTGTSEGTHAARPRAWWWTWTACPSWRPCPRRTIRPCCATEERLRLTVTSATDPASGANGTWVGWCRATAARRRRALVTEDGAEGPAGPVDPRRRPGCCRCPAWLIVTARSLAA